MSDNRLAERIGTSAAVRATGTSLAARGAQPANVMQLFEYGEYRKELDRTLNDKEMVRRFLQAGLTSCQRDPKLQECSWQSFAGALMQCAVVKLEPGPALGHCWVLPFGPDATFVLGYPGVIQLAWRSGMIQDVNASSVCEGDEFMYDEGAQLVVHKRPTRGRRGAAYAYYSVVRYTNGGRHVEFMTREEVEDHAQRFSKSYQSKSAKSPWRTDFDAMAEKTCVLQGKRYMPASIEWSAAIAGDEQSTIWTPGSGLRPENLTVGQPVAAQIGSGEGEAEPPPTPVSEDDERLAAEVEEGLRRQGVIEPGLPGVSGG